MKVALVTPHYHQQRGNTVTVERISHGLNQLGISTEVVSITNNKRFPLLPAVNLVHGFNAYEFHKYWKVRGSLCCPFLVTLTGTDINQGFLDKKTKGGLIQTLDGSKAIHVFNNEARNLLRQEAPGLNDKIHLIPQGICNFPPSQGTVRKEKGSFIFVLPAGIRKVKNIPAAISLLTPLYDENPSIRLWIVGPILDKMEGDIVRKMVEQKSHWVRYWGEIPHGNMGEIYRQADVVLNTSLSEGQSSAILEAMNMGIPVLVSNVAGNRDIVEHGKTGFLYNGESEFTLYARHLIEDEGLRKSMGNMGQDYVRANHSSEKEALALQKLYREIFE